MSMVSSWRDVAMVFPFGAYGRVLGGQNGPVPRLENGIVAMSFYLPIYGLVLTTIRFRRTFRAPPAEMKNSLRRITCLVR